MKGKRVVITGTSGGIGGAGAARFAELGAQVVGIDVVAGAATDVVADLTDPDAVAAALADAAERLGGLDVLWLNAGVMTRARNEDPMDDPIESLTAAGYRRVFDVNVGANVVAISAAIPLLGDDVDADDPRTERTEASGPRRADPAGRARDDDPLPLHRRILAQPLDTFL